MKDASVRKVAQATTDVIAFCFLVCTCLFGVSKMHRLWYKVDTVSKLEMDLFADKFRKANDMIEEIVCIWLPTGCPIYQLSVVAC